MKKPEERSPVTALWWVNPRGYQLVESSTQTLSARLTTEFSPRGGLCVIEDHDEDPEDYFWIPVSDEDSGTRADGAHVMDWLILIEDRSDPEMWRWMGDFEHGFHTYDPLREAGLHRQFASLSGDRKRILAFANRFGFLGANIASIEHDDRFFWAESLNEWCVESEFLHVLLDLWDAIRNEAPIDKLWEFVETDAGSLFFPHTVEDRYPILKGWIHLLSQEISIPREPIDKSETWDAEMERLTRIEARVLLHEHVIMQLAEHTLPAFEFGPGGQVGFKPKNLLGAIYALFLQELLGRSDPLFRCASCGKWFVQRHASKIYCSAACKQKAFRRGMTHKRYGSESKKVKKND